MLLHTRHRYIYFHRQLSYNLHEYCIVKILVLLYNGNFRFQASREGYWFYNKKLVFGSFCICLQYGFNVNEFCFFIVLCEVTMNKTLCPMYNDIESMV